MEPQAALGILAGSALLILFCIVLGVILIIIPYWKIFGKTGNSPALSLLLFVPLANIIVIYWLAFSDWPALRGRVTAAPPQPYMPPPPPQPAGFHCPLCGAKLDGEQAFCTSCGSAVKR